MNIFTRLTERNQRKRTHRAVSSHLLVVGAHSAERLWIQHIEGRTPNRAAPLNSNSSPTLMPRGIHEQSHIPPPHKQWRNSERISPRPHDFTKALFQMSSLLLTHKPCKLKVTWISFTPPGQQVSHSLLPHHSIRLLAQLTQLTQHSLQNLASTDILKSLITHGQYIILM